MTEHKPPPRSLRGEGPRYYRDWSSVGAPGGSMLDGDRYVPTPRPNVDEEDEPYEDEPYDEPDQPEPLSHEAYDDEDELPRPMVPPPYDDDEDEPYPSHSSSSVTDYEEDPIDQPKVKVKSSLVQRARRASDRKDDPTPPVSPQAASAIETPSPAAASRPKTAKLESPKIQTGELKSNIKQVANTLEDTKKAADAIGQNIKNKATNTALNLLNKARNLTDNLANLFKNKLKRKKTSHDAALDLEDAPLAQVASAKKKQTESDDILPPIPDATDVMYADLMAQGITFQTFDKQPLFSGKGTPEEIQAQFLANAIQDVKKCIKLVESLPAPPQGPYMGFAIKTIFAHVREKDICFFLYYVRAKASTFKNKDFKFSEVFASWLLKRSHQTINTSAATDNFPKIPEVSYAPLFNRNIKFQTLDKKAMVIGTGKSETEIDAFFLTNAVDDVRKCVRFVEQFPPPSKGPYAGRQLCDIFTQVQERDIYFFLHYIKQKPELFQNKNFKFSEAFASWVLSKSHETNIMQGWLLPHLTVRASCDFWLIKV